MLKVCLGALAGALFACASLPQYPAVYLTETPRTVHTDRADSVLMHVDEKMELRLNSTLILGRGENMEQAACGHIARHRDHEVWVDSIATAYIVTASPTMVVFSCPSDQVPIHFHVILARDGWDQCGPSPMDMARVWSRYPAELLVCGLGPDSLIAWRAKP